MLLASDEFARTQMGNNNDYCQDNEISWLTWDLQEKGKSLIQFVQTVCALRHKYPIFHRDRFLTGDFDEELQVKDVTWINASGVDMRPQDWSDEGMRCFGMLIDGRARPTGLRQRGLEATMLLVLNAHHDLLEFTLPECAGGEQWSLELDTNVTIAAHQAASGDVYGVTPRSLVFFRLVSD